MRRIGLAVVLAVSLILTPLAADAQQATKIARIGYLSSDLTGSARNREAFLQGLRDLGYIERQNVLIEYRDAERKPERLPALAAELAALKIDIIVTGGGTAAALAAKKASTTLPIVFIGVGDPVSDGLVASLARPGGNVTGFSLLGPELVGKSLELLKQAVPGVSRVALLVKPDATPNHTMNRQYANLLRRSSSSWLRSPCSLRLVDDREEDGVQLVLEDDHCGFAAASAITRAAASGESTSVLTTRS
jgi:putative ABC transport system substrate-binding protein